MVIPIIVVVTMSRTMMITIKRMKANIILIILRMALDRLLEEIMYKNKFRWVSSLSFFVFFFFFSTFSLN
jgi:hypothetical protein